MGMATDFSNKGPFYCEAPMSLLECINTKCQFHDPEADLNCGGERGGETAIASCLKARLKPTKVICLCGSTRFTEQMLIKQWELTKAGNIVLSWCALPDCYFDDGGEDPNASRITGGKWHIGDSEGVKAIVDEVHKRKIDLSDEVFVLNFGGYIGESTTSEVKYALRNGKPVNWMEPESMPDWARP